MAKEQEFYNALEDVFVGARIEGESGYINLMRIKSRYFREKVFPQLQQDIEAVLDDYPEFRSELFDKLYDFFHRYFSESGSIYFRRTRYPQSVYEHVYTDDKDVILFWKTRMLYYVKTVRLFKNLQVELGDYTFIFNVSELQAKTINDKRDLVYRFDRLRQDGGIVITVEYSTHGSKTKMLDILRALRGEDVDVSEDVLEHAFRIFEKQSEVDYFINKDADKFLKQQFDLWMHRYLFGGDNIWLQRRIEQLQALKRIAFNIIDFIAQFEEELVRIWNKPKFVINSDYVISLKTLRDIIGSGSIYADYVAAVKKQLAESEAYRHDVGDTIKEVYRDNVSGIFVSHCEFNIDSVQVLYYKRTASGDERTQPWQNYSEARPSQIPYDRLYIDTRFFESSFKHKLLGDIAKQCPLHAVLDGRLIKSENWQAMNSISRKYMEKVTLIYIDPPFNTKESGFLYQDRFLDTSWLSMMNDRLDKGIELLRPGGNLYLHLDENADFFGRLLLSDKLDFQRELIWNVTAVAYSEQKKTWIRSHDVLLYYTKGQEPEVFNPVRQEQGKGWDVKKMGSILGGEGDDILTTKYTLFNRNENVMGFNTQKTESLVARLIEVSSNQGDMVLDYFAGTGTTLAAAHKMNRQWLGVEMADYFGTITLPRMKKVIFGDHRGISPDTDWKGGGFFKYYEMEQYEDVLRNAVYVEAAEPFDNPYEDPYQQYVFLRDLKMLDALEVDHEANDVRVDLSKLYDDIDVAETLANLRGKSIARITPEFVEFQDGERIDLQDLDWQLIKPLIWW